MERLNNSRNSRFGVNRAAAVSSLFIGVVLFHLWDDGGVEFRLVATPEGGLVRLAARLILHVAMPVTLVADVRATAIRAVLNDLVPICGSNGIINSVLMLRWVFLFSRRHTSY